MKYLKPLLLFFIILFIGPALFSFNASAGTEDASMSDFKLTITPYRQGVGGEITIEASVSFFGGCCYSLFAYDVRTTIVLPENVQLVKGSLTQQKDEVEATEGGAATTVHFKWTVKSMVPDTYVIKVNLTTKNCGNLNADETMEVIEGCSMTIPTLYPDNPSTKKDTFVMLDVSCGLEGVVVENVNLFYIKSGKKLASDTNKIYADNDTILWPGGSKSGTPAIMEGREFTDNTWKGAIQEQKDETIIYYWIVAKDNTGKNTTSIVYSYEVLEIDRIYFIADILNWLPILGTLIGIILIVFLYNKFRNPTIGKGVHLLGSDSIKEIHSTIIDSTFQNKLYYRRLLIAILLLIVAIIVLIWAMYSGHLEQFTRLNGEI